MSRGLQSLQRKALQQLDRWAPPEQRGQQGRGLWRNSIALDTHRQEERRGKKHRSPYLLLAQDHRDMEWKWGLQKHVRSSGFCEGE